MNGNQRQSLIRRLLEGDNPAQDLAFKLFRANESKATELLERHADIVAQYPAPKLEEDEHPTLL
jgi:hypothetical protein